MVFTIDPDLIKNNDVEITDDESGNLAIKHIPSGEVLTIDESTSLSDLADVEAVESLKSQTSGLSEDGSEADLSALTTGKVNGFVYPERHGAVGDGVTDDTQAIQDALDHAEDGETTGFALRTGKVYRITSKVTADISKVRKINGNNALIIVDGDFEGLHILGSHDGASFRNADPEARDNEFHPIVSGLRITSPYGDEDDNDPVGTGVIVDKTMGLVFEANHLYNLNNGFVFRDSNRNSKIANNEIWNCADYGIHSEAGHDHHQLNITSNVIQWCRKGIYVVDPVELHDCSIVGNNIEADGPVDNLIHFEATGNVENTESRMIEIVGNELEDHHDVTDAIIAVDSSGEHVDWQRYVFVGNTISNSGSHGIRLSGGLRDVNIVANPLYNNDKYSILVEDDIDSFVVSANHGGHSYGGSGGFLRIDGTAGEHSNEVNISDNVFRSTEGTDPTVDITGLSAQRFNFVDNGFTAYDDNTGWGINIQLEDMNNVGVRGNHLDVRGPQDGMRVGGSGDENLVIVKDNTVRTGRGDGGATAYDLPAEVEGTVVVNDNLDDT